MRGYIITLLILPIIFVLGCSSSGIVTPSHLQDSQNYTQSGKIGGSRVLWGLWDIAIDPETYEIDMTPLRNTQFTCNVTRFLQPPLSPIHLLSIEILPGSSPADGYFELDVAVRHPFPGANKFNGFDVRGILLADGTQVSQHDPSVILSGDGETRLKNADGYTRWWNYPEFTSYGTIFGFTTGLLGPPNQPTATVNPYKYFADGFSSTSPMSEFDTSNRGQFSTEPGINSRQYNIQFKMDAGHPVLDFQYAIDASWALPDEDYAPDYPPEAYPLSANMAEPFMLLAADSGSTAWYVDPDHYGGELVLDLQVFDWQGPLNPSGALQEFTSVWLEGGILDSPVDAMDTGLVVAADDLSALLRVTLDDLNLTKSGLEYLLVTIPSSNPVTYMPQVPGGENFSYPDSPLSAYFAIPVNISDEEPSEPGPGKIVWVSNQDGNPEIYRMQGDGTMQTRLTQYGDHDWEPHWSPDGTQIVWRRGGYGDANLWLMNEDGSDQHQITFDGWNFDPVFHPSGEWIYYWSYDGEGDAGTKIWKVRPDGSDQQQVTYYDDEGAFAAPTFNHAGDLMAMEGPGPGGGPRDIWTAGIDGSNPVNLTEYEYWDANPDFSHDDQLILFSKEIPRFENKLFTMELDGSNVTQVTFPDEGQDDYGGVFGLNDEYIILYRRLGSGPDTDEICKYILETGELIQLTDNNAFDQYPQWHPDD